MNKSDWGVAGCFTVAFHLCERMGGKELAFFANNFVNWTGEKVTSAVERTSTAEAEQLVKIAIVIMKSP